MTAAAKKRAEILCRSSKRFSSEKLSFASELFTYLSSFIAALYVSSPDLDTERISGELAQTKWEIIE